MQCIHGTGALLALALVLGQVGQAQPPNPEVLMRPESLYTSLRDVIEYGVQLYNDKGDYAGCYRLFQGSLIAVRPYIASNKALLKQVDDSLTSAEKLPRVNDRALLLRGSLDEIRKAFAPVAKKVEKLPEPKKIEPDKELPKKEEVKKDEPKKDDKKADPKSDPNPDPKDDLKKVEDAKNTNGTIFFQWDGANETTRRVGASAYVTATLPAVPPEKMHVPFELDKSVLAEKRVAAWKDLRRLSREKKVSVHLYAENPALTHICFISNSREVPPFPDFYVYDVVKKELKIVQIPHALPIGINQITFESSKERSVFVLWYYGQREAIIDPAKI